MRMFQEHTVLREVNFRVRGDRVGGFAIARRRDGTRYIQGPGRLKQRGTHRVMIGDVDSGGRK